MSKSKFDIFDHNFKGAEEYELELDESDDDSLDFYCDGYPKFYREDVIAMAKHFGITDKDLN